MSERNKALQDVLADLWHGMPDGPPAGKLGVMVAAMMRISGLEAGEAWCSIAAACAVAHGSETASVQVGVPDGEGGRDVIEFQSTGEVAVRKYVPDEDEAPLVH